MRVLLTNDDGIMAPGINYALKAIRSLEFVKVEVVAPERERSAIGHAITLHRPLQVQEVDMDGFLGRAVNGTPADCSKLAVEALLEEPPDLVVSGINHGYNLGYDVLYSGTVSAAIEGVLLGIPSMAVSVSSQGGEEEFVRAAGFICQAVSLLAGCSLNPKTLLNVNVPSHSDVSEVAVTRLADKHYRDIYDQRRDPRGRAYYWLARRDLGEPEEGTDLEAVARGQISVTPLHFQLTDRAQVEDLPQWFKLKA